MSHRAADSRRHDPLRPTSSCHIVDGCIFLIITSLGNICQNICHKCTQDVKIHLPGVYEKTSLNFNSMDLSKSISHKCTQEHLPAVFIDTTYETAAAIINSTIVTYLAKHSLKCTQAVQIHLPIIRSTSCTSFTFTQLHL